MSNEITLTIQIGNSDDKLTQKEWCQFVRAVNTIVEGSTIHFAGGPPSDAPWQNHCWVITVPAKDAGLILTQLVAIRSRFRQDSVAVTSGQTTFY